MQKLMLKGLLWGGCGLAVLGGQSLVAQAPGQSAPSPSSPSPQSQPRPDATTPGQAGGANTPETTAKVDDKKFVKEAAIGGMMEVELGKVAAQKGQSEGVKQFGQKMVDDHSKANDQLKEVATKEGMEIPSSLDAKHQAKVDKMSSMSGDAFDKAYTKNMLKDHQKDVNDFQTEAQNGTNPNVKQFAAATLPTLKEHLSMVQDLKKKK